VNKKVISLDFKTDRESLIRTACGSKFQTEGAEIRKVGFSRALFGWMPFVTQLSDPYARQQETHVHRLNLNVQLSITLTIDA